MRHIYKLTIISALFILNSCSNQAPTESEALTEKSQQQLITLTKVQISQAGIVFGKLVPKEISHKIKVNGLLDVPPQNLMSITAPYGGNLKHTQLLQGLHVHKGDVIATMEHPDYIQLQQDYLENKSQLGFLKDEFERQKELSKEEVNSKKTFQKSKAEYETMKARVNGLKAKLELIRVDMNQLELGNIQKTIQLYAPINGYVTKVNVSIGSFVSSNTVLFEIIDTEHLHAEISVFEKDLPSIKVGQEVQFSLANETKIRHANVYLIGREINADRTVRVHCHLKEEDRNLLPGMYLTAYIEVKNIAASALPNQAIVEQNGKSYVFVLEKNTNGNTTFKQVEVEKTGSEDGYTTIQQNEALNNQTIAVKGAYKLLAALNKEEEE